MIAVDVMSGEKPPEIIIRGALRAAESLDVKVGLVGDRQYIENYLRKVQFKKKKLLRVYHAPEIIGMHEKPTSACRQKKNASIVVCTSLIKEGKAKGLFSPGNTGATLVASLMNIGKTEGVLRPGLMSFLPTLRGASLIIDAGANTECTSEYLAQYAVMGEIFARIVQGKKNPSVGILSIGVEKSKGKEITIKAYDLLKDLDFNFVGNIEGYDVSEGDVDVVVCDGFVGNIVLKVTERVMSLPFEMVGQEIGAHLLQRIGYALIYPAVRKLHSRIDASEYGGAPLLGLKGNVVIGHGKSDALATFNGIRIVNLLIQHNVNELMVKRLDEFGLIRQSKTTQK